MSDAFREGIKLFNARKFFECHEALEILWLKEKGEEKIFLQGLIQVAAAFHHQIRRNPEGARLLLEEGWNKLLSLGETRRGVNLDGLRRQLQLWREHLRQDSSHEAAAPPLPLIAVTTDEPGKVDS